MSQSTEPRIPVSPSAVQVQAAWKAIQYEWPSEVPEYVREELRAYANKYLGGISNTDFGEDYHSIADYIIGYDSRQLEDELSKQLSENARLSAALADEEKKVVQAVREAAEQYMALTAALAEKQTELNEAIKAHEATLAKQHGMAVQFKSLQAQLASQQEALSAARNALVEIRNSSGEQVMVTTAEGHSFCVHTANAALARVNACLPEGTK